jgi:HlyD family secretion protein
MKKGLIILAMLAAVVAGAWHFYDKYRSEHSPLQLYGNVDIRGVDIGFRVGGRLLEVFKDEGDPVKAGELLARIDGDPYRREIDQSKASLAAAEADYQLKQAGYRAEEIEQARATLAQNIAATTNAGKILQRQNELVKGGSISRQDLETAETNHEESVQRVKVSEANLKRLEAGFRVEEIAASAAQVEQAKAALASAELRLTDTELKAPSDGVLLTRAIEPGTVLSPGATVLSISLENPVWVRAYVHETELGQVAPGTRVLIHTDADPSKPFHGKVGFVSPRAEFTPKSVETPHLRTSLVYRLRIIVEDSDGTLRQGMPVTISLDPGK